MGMVVAARPPADRPHREGRGDPLAQRLHPLHPAGAGRHLVGLRCPVRVVLVRPEIAGQRRRRRARRPQHRPGGLRPGRPRRLAHASSAGARPGARTTCWSRRASSTTSAAAVAGARWPWRFIGQARAGVGRARRARGGRGGGAPRRTRRVRSSSGRRRSGLTARRARRLRPPRRSSPRIPPSPR